MPAFRHTAALALASLLAAPAAAQTWDARADYGTTTNPNGVWTYGYATGTDGRLDEGEEVPPTASTATWLEGLGAIAVADGHPDRAARLLGAADGSRYRHP